MDKIVVYFLFVLYSSTPSLPYCFPPPATGHPLSLSLCQLLTPSVSHSTHLGPPIFSPPKPATHLLSTYHRPPLLSLSLSLHLILSFFKPSRPKTPQELLKAIKDSLMALNTKTVAEVKALEKEWSPSLEDCLKLLKGERDEQRLAGLLLITKFCKGGDHASIRKVFDAVGIRFLDRLLQTGMGKGSVSANGGDNRSAYLQLSVTVLAAFCRVPEIASSKDMVLKIPLILEIMSKSSHLLELAMRLTQLIISKLSLDIINNRCPSELSMMVATIAKQFAVLHNALKFEALHLLSMILSSKYSAPIYQELRLMTSDIWSTYIRIGIVAILQNRVAPAEKLHALILAESMISMLGEEWLIGQMNLSDREDPVPADRCILLVLESSRVEIAVLLNEIAYLKYEASKSSSSSADAIFSKQRNLAIVFSLVEKIIKLISNAGGDEGSVISDSTFAKVISGLNETIAVVLEYLQDAKDHGQKKGDDLLASVRITGSYLAETPLAWEEKVRELLEYMLSVEGEDEPSPLYSICFLLPMLCQITMKIDGCKVLASSGACKAVVDCLIKLIGPNSCMVEDSGIIFLACDTIMNLLLMREQIQFSLDDSHFAHLLLALAYWTEQANDPSVLMMAASICALIFDLTSEEALVQHQDFNRSNLISLSQLILKSLAICDQDMKSDDAKAEMDLHEIVASSYSRWDRFPSIKEAVER